MSKINASSGNVLICCAIASMVVLAGQLGSWGAQQCQEPNINTLAYFTPPAGALSVTGCVARDDINGHCSNSHVYTINTFPDGAKNADSGTTTQKQSDCWQDTPCQWNPDTGCQRGTTFPSATTYHQAVKTVVGDAMCSPNGK